MNDRRDDLDALLLDWESGDLDQPGIDRLRKLLREDEAARARFLRQQLIAAALHEEADAEPHRPVQLAEQAPSAESQAVLRRDQRAFEGPGVWAACAAAVVACIAGAWWLQTVAQPRAGGVALEDGDSTRPSREAKASGIALVTRLVAASWKEESDAFEVGEAVGAGRFSISSGMFKSSSSRERRLSSRDRPIWNWRRPPRLACEPGGSGRWFRPRHAGSRSK